MLEAVSHYCTAHEVTEHEEVFRYNLDESIAWYHVQHATDDILIFFALVHLHLASLTVCLVRALRH